MANGLWLRERSGRDEVWITFDDHAGKRRREKIGLDTPDIRLLAKDVLTKRRNEAMTNKHFPERMVLDTTFREAAERYWNLIGCKRDKGWRCRWDELVREFGCMRLVDVKPDKIQGWYNRKVADTSSGTANTTLNLLCAIFNRATDWDMFSAVNPVRKVLTEEDPEPRTRFLNAAEMKAFFAASDERLLPIVVFALLTGLRRSESLDFRWEDVDLERFSIKAHRGKKGINPDIPASEKLCALLKHLGPRKDGRLFDLCPMTFRRLFEKARKDCGVEHFTWHDLRRTFGSHFAMATKDLPSLRKLLGHRTNNMVNRYAYLTDDHLRTQMVAFDAAMPELPASLRQCVPIDISHHPSHQAVASEVAE